MGGCGLAGREVVGGTSLYGVHAWSSCGNSSDYECLVLWRLWVCGFPCTLSYFTAAGIAIEDVVTADMVYRKYAGDRTTDY